MLAGAALVMAASLFAPDRGFRARLVRTAGLVLGLVAVLLPWVIRNAWVLGEPVWTTTHGGYTLSLANNEVYYRDVVNGPPGRVWTGHDQWLWWDSVNRDTAGMPEPSADRFLRNRALALIVAQPRTFLRAASSGWAASGAWRRPGPCTRPPCAGRAWSGRCHSGPCWCSAWSGRGSGAGPRWLRR